MAGEKKKAYIIALLRAAQNITDTTDDISDWANEYVDNGYNSGGTDPISDADMNIHDLTVADFDNLITFMQQFQNFMGNSAVTTGDYAKTLNVIRRAPGV